MTSMCPEILIFKEKPNTQIFMCDLPIFKCWQLVTKTFFKITWVQLNTSSGHHLQPLVLSLNGNLSLPCGVFPASPSSTSLPLPAHGCAHPEPAPLQPLLRYPTRSGLSHPMLQTPWLPALKVTPE